MPQVFGAEQIGLISQASLWAEAGFLEDVEEHENALGSQGFESGNVPTHIDRSGFHPRGEVWGQHLRSDPGKTGNHTWAIARVQNPDVDPNARQTDVGGAKPRYAVEIHSVPKDPSAPRARGGVTPVWEGNDIRHFLSGRPGGGVGWTQIQNAMSKGPRR